MRMKSLWCALAPVALTAAALGLAPVAAASPESQFLDELTTDNVWLPNETPAEVIAAGYLSCAHLRSNPSVLDEITAVEQAYQFDQGTLFVSAATTNLCPDFAG